VAYNKLSSVDHLLKNLPGLQVLDASHNLIEKFECKKKLPNLEHLDISYNKITTIDTDYVFPNIITFNISNNELIHARDITAFKYLEQLAELDIAENPISAHMEPTIPEILPYLEVFNQKTLQKPGYKERCLIDQMRREADDPDYFSDLNESYAAGDENDMSDMRRSTMTGFFSSKGMQKGGKDPLMMTSTKLTKKKDDVIDNGEKLQEFMDKFSLDLYSIKCKADILLKMRFPEGLEKPKSQQSDQQSVDTLSPRREPLEKVSEMSSNKAVLVERGGTPKKNVIIKTVTTTKNQKNFMQTMVDFAPTPAKKLPGNEKRTISGRSSVKTIDALEAGEKNPDLDEMEKEANIILAKHKNEFNKLRTQYKTTNYKDLMTNKSKNKIKLSKAIDVGKKLENVDLKGVTENTKENHKS
jgi:Leucine-rich repeat (LRR) protein